jgi:hypothetical protein
MNLLGPPWSQGSPASVPIGSVVAFAGQALPVSEEPNRSWADPACAGAPIAAPASRDEAPRLWIEAQGWMACDGRELAIHEFPELFAVLGYLYGRGEATFRIPDYRGLFLRGVDAGAGLDPNAAERRPPQGGDAVAGGVGSQQCDAFQDHQHDYRQVPVAGTSAQGSGAGVGAQSLPTTGALAPARSSAETRPRNVAVHFLLKFRH